MVAEAVIRSCCAGRSVGTGSARGDGDAGPTAWRHSYWQLLRSQPQSHTLPGPLSGAGQPRAEASK